MGDGNGIIEGNNGAGLNSGCIQDGGETAVFWADLSQANMLDGSFTIAYATGPSVSPGPVSAYLPAAKIGLGNYVYVWSGGYNNGFCSEGLSNSLGITPGQGNGTGDATNYFGIADILGTNNHGDGSVASNGNMPVSDAFSIDTKIDDGYPQTGGVTIMEVGNGDGDPNITWATGCSISSGSGPAQYTLANGGSNQACALSFRFQ